MIPELMYILEDIQHRWQKITQHRSKYSDGVNFGPIKFMIKMLHTIIGLRLVLEHHLVLLAIDRLTTHIIENYFGQNRLNCKGNNRLNRVLNFFIEGSFDYQLTVPLILFKMVHLVDIMFLF